MTDPTPRLAPWQIWWADLDPVRGHEQADVRPVLIVSSRYQLRTTHSMIVTVLPLTTRERLHFAHRTRIELEGQQRASFVITEQVRSISANRLTGRQPICQLDQRKIDEIRDVLRRMIDL